MESVGGFFELEIRKGGHYHQNAIRLNTARSCFEYVLRARNYSKVYVPYYTCSVMLEPISRLKIAYEFYHINEFLEPVTLPELEAREAFLYTNYYGLKQECVKDLAKVYGTRLIVDNAQAFFAEPVHGTDTFYSARKFFGVPDGAYLYTGKALDLVFEQDVSYDRMSHLLKRTDLGAEPAYNDFLHNDDSLCNQGIKRMSRLTESLLSGIDYKYVKRKRRENYSFLDDSLRDSNLIHLKTDDEVVPMVYPYLTDDASLRQRLIDNKIFVATYWPNVRDWVLSDLPEYGLTDRLLPIPTDQRYGAGHMERILEVIKQR